MTREYSRQYVLAGFGIVGAGPGASVPTLAGESRAYTGYTTSDSATFDLEFRAAPCDDSNPFDESGGENGNGNRGGGW